MEQNSAEVQMNGAYEDRTNFLKLMQRESDEQHKLSYNDILKLYKKSAYNAPSRNTLLKMIDEFHACIKKCRVDNQGNRTKEMYYYYQPCENELSEEELTVLLHAVQTLQCIDGETKSSIAKKLLALTNKYYETAYRAISSPHGQGDVSFCTVNMHDLSVVIEALKNRKRIQFNYYKYTYDKQKRRASGKDFYEVDPITLYIDNGFLYLIANNAGIKNGGRRTYRVDRMGNVRITDDVVETYKINLDDFKTNVFSMYTGEKQTVRIECHEDLASTMVDKFGDFKLISPKSPNFIFETTVEISNTFFSWLTTFGARAKLVAPSETVQAFKTYLADILAEY